MTARKPTILYVGSDTRWEKMFARFISDIAYSCLREDENYKAVLIDGEVVSLKGILEEVAMAQSHNRTAIIVVPRGVPNDWREKITGSRVCFVTGKRNFQVLRPQIERVIKALPDQDD